MPPIKTPKGNLQVKPVAREHIGYIGVDPGKKGGIAVIDYVSTKREVRTYKMPQTEMDILTLFRDIAGLYATGYVAMIEKVTGAPQRKAKEGQKQNTAPGSAMFNFGGNYYGLRMAMLASGIRFDPANSRKWQNTVNVPKKPGETRTSHKNRLKARAQELFPGVNVILDTADALLLAHYCQLFHEGKL